MKYSSVVYKLVVLINIDERHITCYQSIKTVNKNLIKCVISKMIIHIRGETVKIGMIFNNMVYKDTKIINKRYLINILSQIDIVSKAKPMIVSLENETKQC